MSDADTEMQAFIDRHVAILEPLARSAALAMWELQTYSSEEARRRSTDLTTRLNMLYANAQEYECLKQIDGVENALAARQHALLLNDYLSNQMDPEVIAEIVSLEVEIEDEFNTYRAVVGGEPVSDNVIDEILLSSRDVEQRRDAWQAGKTIGARLRDKLLKLVRIRNREARRLGFPDYYVMSLRLQEIDETRLFDLLSRLDASSDVMWREYKTQLDAALGERYGIAPSEVRPWHYSNRFLQEPEPGAADLDRFYAGKDLADLTDRFFRAIGLPVDDLLRAADLEERPGKCQHAFCMDVDRRGDVRVLCNNRSNERWMGTMLHEFGHAIYDKFHDPGLPYLLRQPAHTMATEAIALFMGRLSKDADWLRVYVGLSAEEVDGIAAAANREVRDHLLVFTRWCLVMAYFERALYADPEQDLDTLWWDIVERFQGVCRPECRSAPDWAAKIHLATAPVYYHNYLLGEMVASQLLSYLRTRVLAGDPPGALVVSESVGSYLRERVFAPGATWPWEAWLEYATGETLNPRYFTDQLEDR